MTPASPGDHSVVPVSAAVAREQAEALAQVRNQLRLSGLTGYVTVLDAAISTLSGATEGGRGGDLAALRELARDLDRLATRARGTMPQELDGDEYGRLAENISEAMVAMADRLGIADLEGDCATCGGTGEVYGAGHYVPGEQFIEPPTGPDMCGPCRGTGTPHQSTAEAPDRVEDGTRGEGDEGGVLAEQYPGERHDRLLFLIHAAVSRELSRHDYAWSKPTCECGGRTDDDTAEDDHPTDEVANAVAVALNGNRDIVLAALAADGGEQ